MYKLYTGCLVVFLVAKNISDKIWMGSKRVLLRPFVKIAMRTSFESRTFF